MLAVVEATEKRTDWARMAADIAASIADHARRMTMMTALLRKALPSSRRRASSMRWFRRNSEAEALRVAEICDALRIIGAACGSTALAAAMHSHIVAVAAWRWKHQGAPTEGLLKRVAGEDLKLVSSGGSDWLQERGCRWTRSRAATA